MREEEEEVVSVRMEELGRAEQQPLAVPQDGPPAPANANRRWKTIGCAVAIIAVPIVIVVAIVIGVTINRSQNTGDKEEFSISSPNMSFSTPGPAAVSSKPCPCDSIVWNQKFCCINDKKRDWDSCNSFCKKCLNSEIACIKDREELECARNLTGEEGSWIGARRNNSTDLLICIDGTALNNSIVEFEGSSDCAVLSKSRAFTARCEAPRKCMCKMTGQDFTGIPEEISAAEFCSKDPDILRRS